MKYWWFAPRKVLHAKEYEVMTWDGQVLIAHYAENLSGEEQPPFSGWFTWSGGERLYGYFREIERPMLYRDKTGDSSIPGSYPRDY